jgi:hypothetical protein
MSVCCDCCLLSGRGLCVGLITLPEESYRLWCVVCDLETSWMRRAWPTGGCCAKKNCWWSGYLTHCSYYVTGYGTYADPSLGLLANCSEQAVCIFREHRLGVLKKCNKIRHELGI